MTDIGETMAGWKRLAMLMAESRGIADTLRSNRNTMRRIVRSLTPEEVEKARELAKSLDDSPRYHIGLGVLVDEAEWHEIEEDNRG